MLSTRFCTLKGVRLLFNAPRLRVPHVNPRLRTFRFYTTEAEEEQDDEVPEFVVASENERIIENELSTIHNILSQAKNILATARIIDRHFKKVELLDKSVLENEDPEELKNYAEGAVYNTIHNDLPAVATEIESCAVKLPQKQQLVNGDEDDNDQENNSELYKVVRATLVRLTNVEKSRRPIGVMMTNALYTVVKRIHDEVRGIDFDNQKSLERMCQLHFDIDLYNIFLSASSRLGDKDGVVNLMNDMKDYDVKGDSESFHHFVAVVLRNQDQSAAEKVLSYMRSRDIFVLPKTIEAIESKGKSLYKENETEDDYDLFGSEG
ncbi:pentatricopeptide repeat-containing protein [Acrasis kona]|uniref:Pentatricopeptide repeat-containing protein n=1 Tax=Acrasis kona TaxID=1008807 RepID=A0AAW2ZHT9_9EUKA